MVVNPEIANRYSRWKLLSKYSSRPANSGESAHTSETAPPSHSHCPTTRLSNKELPLGPSSPHHCRSGSVPPSSSSTYILSAIPVGEVGHYTAECLMSRWCPFSSNVWIQSSSIFDHLGGESSLHWERNDGNSPDRKQPSWKLQVVIIRACSTRPHLGCSLKAQF